MSASKQRIYHRVQVAAHRMQKAADRRLLAAAGITTAQAAVLAIVAGDPAATQRSVAKLLGINESAVTAMSNRLLGMGLIEKVRSEADGRAWRLTLTAGGRAALRKIQEPFAMVNERIGRALQPDELERLADCLSRLAEAFDAGD